MPEPTRDAGTGDAGTDVARGRSGERRTQRRPAAAAWWRALRTPSGIIGVTFLAGALGAGLLAERIAPGDPFASAGPALSPPSSEHLMGTDNFGRDIAQGVIYGLSTSMTIVLWVVAISFVIGVTVGMVSGYRGGWVDDVLSRITEVFQSIPLFFLALLVVGFFGSGIDNLILLLAFSSWELLARVVRAETLSLREREFIAAARSSGASTLRILLTHVLPNIAPTAVVVMALVGSRVILIEAALSFIGLGDPNEISLGYLLSSAQPFLRVAWWMSIFPGLAIVIAVLGLNLTGDVINDALDPKGAIGTRRGRRNRSSASTKAAPDLAASTPVQPEPRTP